MIIAIDGPAGAGKSTVARQIASRLGLPYLESGLIYRAIARRALDDGVAADLRAFHRWLEEATIEVETSPAAPRCLASGSGPPPVSTAVRINGRLVEGDLKSAEVSQLASELSADKLVRQRILECQRKVGRERGVVAEGRDMTTVVFPEAEHKFFLDASFEERVKRLYNYRVSLGYPADIDRIRAETRERDVRDSTRDVAPLRRAEGAVYIDSTNLSVDEVVRQIMERIR